MASLALGIAGAAIGFVVSGGNPLGAQLGWMLGAGIGGQIDASRNPVHGPRLEDLRPQCSAYGWDIPLGYGTFPVAGNVVWASKFEEIVTSTGGKGGPSVEEYSYLANFTVLLCEGPIDGVLRIWAGPEKRLIYDARPTSIVALESGTIKIYLGDETQLPDPFMESFEGAGNVPAYRGWAYAVLTSYAMKKDGNHIPFLLFEVVQKAQSGVAPSQIYGPSKDADRDPVSGRVWANPWNWRDRELPDTGSYWDARFGNKIVTYDPHFGTGYDPCVAVINSKDDELQLNGSVTNLGSTIYVGRGAPITGFEDPNAECGVGEDGVIAGKSFSSSGETTEYKMDRCMILNFGGTYAGDGEDVVFYWPTTPVFATDSIINGLWFLTGNGAGSYAWGWRYSGQEWMRDENLKCKPVKFYDYFGKLYTSPCLIEFINANNNSNWMMQSIWVPEINVTITQGYQNKLVVWSKFGTPQEFDLPKHFDADFSPVTVDVKNECLWIWCTDDVGRYNYLYTIKNGGSEVSNANPNNIIWPFGYNTNWDVKFSVYDSRGWLRLVAFNTADDKYHNLLFDPINLKMLDDQIINLGRDVLFINRPGYNHKGWNYEQEGFLIVNANVSGSRCSLRETAYVLKIPYNCTLTPEHIHLWEIVRDISLRVGLTDQQLDVSQLTDIVDGYVIAQQTPARGAIEILMPAYYFDAVESDGKVKFVKRGGSIAHEFENDDELAVREFGSDLPDALTTVNQTEDELPLQIDVKFFVEKQYYDPGNKHWRKMIGYSLNRGELSFPLVLSDQKGQEVADVNGTMSWVQRRQYELSWSRKYAYLEPTDLVVAHGQTMRVISLEESPVGVFIAKAIADDTLAYTPHSITTTSPDPTSHGGGDVIPSVSQTRFEAMDIALIQDGDQIGEPCYYVAACDADQIGYWPGCVIYISDDAGLNYKTTSLSITTQATIGNLTNKLGMFNGGNIVDEGNTITVKLVYGTLESVSLLEMLNGRNLAVVGNEILQFRDATLNSDGSYTLSGLLRGRRGSERFMSMHRVSSRFVLLNEAVVRVQCNLDTLFKILLIKAITIGGTQARTPTYAFKYLGIEMACYRPCEVNVGSTPVNVEFEIREGRTVRWVPRSRWGGAWIDYVDVIKTDEIFYSLLFYDSTNNLVGLVNVGWQNERLFSVPQLNASFVYLDPYNYALEQNLKYGGIPSGESGSPFAGAPEYWRQAWSVNSWLECTFIDVEYLRTISSYAITCESEVENAPKSWVLETQDVVGNWETVDTRNAVGQWTTSLRREYAISCPRKTQVWRIRFLENYGGSYVDICKLELISTDIFVRVFQSSPYVGVTPHVGIMADERIDGEQFKLL